MKRRTNKALIRRYYFHWKEFSPRVVEVSKGDFVKVESALKSILHFFSVKNASKTFENMVKKPKLYLLFV